MAEYQPAQLERIPKPSMEPPQRQKAHAPAAPHPLVSLQAHVGNQAIARMIQREDEGAEIEDEEEIAQAKHDPAIQRAPEEEEMAQAKHDPAVQRAPEEEEMAQAKHDTGVQRIEEEDAIQAKHDDDLAPQVGLEGGPVGADIEKRIDSMRGSGSVAPDGIRRQMEAATGTNLGGVRVHEGAEASALNHQLTAKAFTTGNDIFLRDDVSSGDSELMAHEMAHVVQQSSGRTASGGQGMSAGAANDPLEAEADSLAHAVLAGGAQRHIDEARA